MIYFLVGNGIVYASRNEDPWYRGTVPGVPYGESSTNATTSSYRPEEAASPMGCIEQFQFCNADRQRCGPLTGYFEAAMGAGPMFGLLPEEVRDNSTGSDPAQSRFLWFAYMPGLVGSYVTVSALGPRALLSVEGLNYGRQGPLPDDQWKRDVAFWWASEMAQLQSTVTSFVRGPQPSLQAFRIPPLDAAQEALCANQVSPSRIVAKQTKREGGTR